VLKWLLIVLLILAVYYFFRKMSVKKEENQNFKKHNKNEEIMLECKKCGTYISSKEAIISNGKYYCSKECLEADK